MAILGVGTDIIRVRRIETAVKRFGDTFLNRLFTPFERAEAVSLTPEKQAAFYAKRYAMKEAVSKALGTGIGRLAAWQEIETRHTEAGQPLVLLSGETAATATRLAGGGKWRIHASLSDDLDAVAFVVLEKIDMP